MPPLWTRVFTLIVVGWANVYCCCTAPAQRVQADLPKHTCCTEKHSKPAQPQHDEKPCNECPYIALRQTTEVTVTHDTIAPPEPCLFANAIAAPVVINITHAPALATTDQPPDVPSALFALHTSLLL